MNCRPADALQVQLPFGLGEREKKRQFENQSLISLSPT
jgi:hypothetical protein